MGNIINHAKKEFLKLGYKPIEESEEDPDKWMQECVLELLEVFSKQGHSGGSAPCAIEYFRKLALQEPISPILCTDDEWNDVSNYGGDIDYQNNRCSAVFKNSKDDKPYYLDAIVWRNNSGSTFTGSAFDRKMNKIYSHQFIKLPFYPKTFYIDVIDKEIAKDDFEHYIKDDSQLEEVWKYYDKVLTISEKRKKKLEKIGKGGK